VQVESSHPPAMATAGSVLVTGVTGLVGRQVATELLARGHAVRGAVRRPVLPAERVRGLEYVDVGDLGPATSWHEALCGVDYVVHAAAHVHVMRPTPQDHAAYVRVNVNGALALAEQAAQAGVRRLVFVSSIKVNGESTPRRPFAADDDPQPLDAFGRCKYDAEAGLLDVASRRGLGVVIVRPPLVYGPGVRGNFDRLIRLIARGVPLPFATIMNRRSLVSVWNLADLVACALVHPSASDKVWLVSDEEDVSTPELIRRIASAMQLPARLWPAPPALLRAAATVLGRRDEVLRLIGSLYVDTTLTRQGLGWRPVMSLDEGLRRTIAGAAEMRLGRAA
jgi:nucleoside-diphosphate-sugar epimerase